MADNGQGSFVRKVDNAIHWINLYPVDSAIDFPNTVVPRLSGPRLSGLFLWSQVGHEYL